MTKAEQLRAGRLQRAGSPCSRCKSEPRLKCSSRCKFCRYLPPLREERVIRTQEWQRVVAACRPRIRPDIHERFEQIKAKALAKPIAVDSPGESNKNAAGHRMRAWLA